MLLAVYGANLIFYERIDSEDVIQAVFVNKRECVYVSRQSLLSSIFIQTRALSISILHCAVQTTRDLLCYVMCCAFSIVCCVLRAVCCVLRAVCFLLCAASADASARDDAQRAA